MGIIKIKTVVLYVFYLILVIEILLRLPFIYNRIFKNYETQNIKFLAKVLLGENETYVAFWTLPPNETFKFIYPYYKYFFFEDKIEKLGKTNSLGFRGKEFDGLKLENKIKIAFLGDSYTFGWGLNDNETFPEKVCSQLNDYKFKNSFECYNFGMPATNTFNQYHILKAEVIKTKPDIIVLSYCINDAEPSAFGLVNNSIDKRKIFLNLFGGGRLLF